MRVLAKSPLPGLTSHWYLGPGTSLIRAHAAWGQEPNSQDADAAASPTTSKEEHPWRDMASGAEPVGSALTRFGRDLTSEARLGMLDPCIGRETVIQRTLQVRSGGSGPKAPASGADLDSLLCPFCRSFFGGLRTTLS